MQALRKTSKKVFKNLHISLKLLEGVTIFNSKLIRLNSLRVLGASLIVHFT